MSAERRVMTPTVSESYLLQHRNGSTVLMRDGATPFRYSRRDLAQTGQRLLEAALQTPLRIVPELRPVLR